MQQTLCHYVTHRLLSSLFVNMLVETSVSWYSVLPALIQGLPGEHSSVDTHRFLVLLNCFTVSALFLASIFLEKHFL